jgi:hypothetical protein
MTPNAAARVWYFGCEPRVGAHSGHHLWDREGGLYVSYSLAPFPLDGEWCPRGPQEEGRALLSRRLLGSQDWTVVAWWDRSVDHRTGSHSTFLARGLWSFDEMLAAAREAFPTVFARQNRPIVQVDG